MARRQTRNDNLRLVLARESARIMAEHGIDDFLLAKRKAAERLGVTERAALPGNQEIERALSEHLRLFAGRTHLHHLRQLRELALGTMRNFDQFQPKLAGAVLNGTATPHSDITLHLFADPAELVAMRLMALHVAYAIGERHIRFADRIEGYPVYGFEQDEVQIEMTVFPAILLRQAPKSPVDGKSMRRAGITELENLIETCQA
ncbi:MAG: hypothetical protein V3S53_04835 [Gammaproteobacteria bacterium]